MNKIILTISLLCLSILSSFAYETKMLNMIVPTNLEKGTLEFSIRHRFYGAIGEDTFDTFLGMDKGANINIGIRFPIITNLETKVNYIRLNSEYSLGFSYKIPFNKYVDSQVNLEYFTFKKFGIGERRSNFFYQLSIQSKPIARRISPVLNFSYDGYYDRIGIASGLSVQIFENWDVITEYYPVLNRDKDADGRVPIGDNNFFAFGIKYKTYAHHFTFIISNGSQIGNRNLILGTSSNKLYFGFNIQRKLYL